MGNHLFVILAVLDVIEHVYRLTDVLRTVQLVCFNNACKCAFVIYFGNGNFREFLQGGGQSLSFITGIPDGHARAV